MATINDTTKVEELETQGLVAELDEHHDPQRGVLEGMKGVRNALTVKRVFDELREVDGVTVIPVARLAGGAGAGGGEGNDDEDGTGSGFGTGFGLRAAPVGVYEVRDGQLIWNPAVDVTRLARMGMVLAGIMTVCATLVAWRRSCEL